MLPGFRLATTSLPSTRQTPVIGQHHNMGAGTIGIAAMASPPSSPTPSSAMVVSFDNPSMQEIGDRQSPNEHLGPITEMHLPPHTTMLAPPPTPTFTVQQLLAYPIQTPSDPSGASVKALAAKLKRATHNSSTASMKYIAIRKYYPAKDPRPCDRQIPSPNRVYRFDQVR